MKSVKGQGIIIEIMIFAVAIFLSIMIFVLLGLGEHERNQEIVAETNFRLDGVTAISGIDSMLHDEIERAPDVNNDYNGKTFYEVLSLYYSTNQAHEIDGNMYARANIRTDLEAYLEHKSEEYWDSSDDDAYRITIGEDDDLIEASNDQELSGAITRDRRPIPLSNGDRTQLEAAISQ